MAKILSMPAGGGQDYQILSLIPKMTSDTTPSGASSASSIYSADYASYKAFNQSTSAQTDRWASSSSDTSAWLGYAFVVPTVVKTLVIQSATASDITGQLQGSNDGGSTWFNIGSSFSIPNQSTASISYDGNATSYTQYRCQFSGYSSYSVWSMQLVGYKKVPPFYLYKDGVFSVGMDNPGGYWTSGGTNVGVTLDTNKFTVVPTGSGYNYSVIGTSQLFDLTPYSTLIVRCKGLTQQGVYGYGDVNVNSSKQTGIAGNQLVTVQINSDVEHSVSLDVTDITSAYINFAANGNKSTEFYEAYLI